MINLETEVVSTSYNELTQECIYVVQKNGKQWTVRIPERDFNHHGPNNQKRREHLATVLELAMNGPEDEK